MLHTVPWLDAHPGLCLVLGADLPHRHGFASRATGGNIHAAQLQGPPATKLILLACHRWRLYPG
jgi:hypothetical protein